MKTRSFVINSSSKEDSLFLPIVFFIIGLILFTNPEGIIDIIAYIFGSILIINGLIRLLIYKMFAKQDTNNSNLFKGFTYIILGTLSIVFFNIIEAAFRITVAAYILYTGINKLVIAISLKNKISNIIPALVLSILMIIFSVCLAFIPGLSLGIIGLFIICYSIVEIVNYIFYSNKKEKKSDDTPEAIIVDEVKEEIKRIDSN